ncbi:MAG: hypothetical protein ACJAT2_000744 [Bacteriovoracaceae bacterium]|jgi:hypothetical protein
MKKLLFISLSLLILNGCAHRFMRGTVAMKMDDSTAHVCLGDNDVQVGDKIDFIQNICIGSNASSVDKLGEMRTCEMKTLGSGTVTKLLNSHYSEVKTDKPFKISEGTLVQKRK